MTIDLDELEQRYIAMGGYGFSDDEMHEVIALARKGQKYEAVACIPDGVTLAKRAEVYARAMKEARTCIAAENPGRAYDVLGIALAKIEAREALEKGAKP